MNEIVEEIFPDVKSSTLCFELMNPSYLGKGDLFVIEPPTPGRPGVAHLVRAVIGKPTPDAPNSRPVYSSDGGKIGFVAQAKLMIGPFNKTYVLK